MVQLGGKGMKALKIFHILFMVMWVGGVMALVSLMLGVKPRTPEMIYMAARTHYIVDMAFLIPGGIGIVVTAFAYALFTKWGFFKQRWITVKWLLTLVLIIIGVGHMGRLIKANLPLAEQILCSGAPADQFFVNVHSVAIAGIVQLAGFLFVIAISVIKPWGRKAKL